MTLVMINGLARIMIQNLLKIAVYKHSSEAAEFFGYERLKFKSRYGSPKTVEEQKLEINYNDGEQVITHIGPSSNGGVFRVEGKENVIEINEWKGVEGLRDVINHEIAHGYHHRYNNSVELTNTSIEDLNRMGQIIMGVPEKKEDSPLLEEEAELISKWMNNTLIRRIAGETIATAYHYIKSERKGRYKEGQTSSIEIVFDKHKLHTLDPHYDGMQIGFVKPSDIIKLKRESILPYITQNAQKGYFFGTEFGGRLSSFFDINDPNISLKETDVENEINYKSGKKMTIIAEFKRLPTEVVSSRLKAAFKEDCAGLAKRVIEQHNTITRVMIERAKSL